MRGDRALKTAICPTCGCSLVRLGIDRINAPSLRFEGVDYRFCCEGCATDFQVAPAKYLSEIQNVVVCPTCLAEKNRDAMVTLVEMHYAQTNVRALKTEQVPFVDNPDVPGLGNVLVPN